MVAQRFRNHCLAFAGDGARHGEKINLLIEICKSIQVSSVAVLDVADEHFVPGLFTPADGEVRVWIILILRRIVEGADASDRRIYWNIERRIEVIYRLPVETVFGHGKQNFCA